MMQDEPRGTTPRTLGGGRYELRGRLGQGASGDVHRALDRRSGAEVAIKVLRSAAPEELYQLKREFRALADVRHPGLARLYDLHIEDEHCFFSMELVPGRDLLRHLDGRAPEERVKEVVAVLPQLIDAIRAVHTLGIVHRDLKPENILVEERPGSC